MIDTPKLAHETVDYWVVFTQGTHFISRVLKPGFSHVYVITHDKYNWITLDPQRLKLAVTIEPYAISTHLPAELMLADSHILHIKMDKLDTNPQFGLFGLTHCVTYVRYILGLRLPTLTPFSLYNKLLMLSPRDMLKHGIQSIRLIAGSEEEQHVNGKQAFTSRQKQS